MTALLTSTKTLESIIENGLANKKIQEWMVSDLVRAKVNMKKAKNILDKSNYIIQILFNNYNKFREAQRAREDAAWNARHFSQPKVQTPSSSETDWLTGKSFIPNINSASGTPSTGYINIGSGGSKKRNTSKRHTKRHVRNNKKRYTKKRR